MARTERTRTTPGLDGSRDRVWRAAAEEFAARGFDGAKVDRIAMRARVNKAMIYYHFTSKAGLYRDIVRDMVASVATAIAAVRRDGGPADDQIRRYIAALAREGLARPHFPSIWLREVAEGGRHLDASVATQFRAVLQALGEILSEGRAAGRFGPAHPFLVQVGIVGPLMFFMATRPMRERFAKTPVATDVTVEQAIAHVQVMTLGALTLTAGRAPRAARAAKLKRNRL